MAVANTIAAQTHVASSNSDVKQLYPLNHMLHGSTGLEGAFTLFRRPFVFGGPGADADLTQLAAVACNQAAVLGWTTLHGVDWEKAWRSPWVADVTSLLRTFLRQAWIVDVVFVVTWNLREDLLCKDYFRFLRKEVCYSYNKETKNEWFTAEITRPEEVVVKATPTKYEIKALNSTDKNRTEMSEVEKNYLELESKPGYWYHGTNHESAVNILVKGIKLTEGNPKQDFSNDYGFYMCPTFTCAKQWAFNTKIQRAVLVFNVRKQLEDKNFQGLDLTGSGAAANWGAVVKLDLTGSGAAADWGAVVKYNRCGQIPCAPLSGEIRKRFDKSDYIIGPMSGGRETRCPTENKEACKRWRPQISGELPNQLCIRTERLAEVFGSLRDQHIEAVVFYGD